ncbi:TLE member 5 [Chytridiales sp. JEL 0842]|nr:TLE member 5 [Chytridiales sp. JEL 0842]
MAALISAALLPLFQLSGVGIPVLAALPPKRSVKLVGPWMATFAGMAGTEMAGVWVALNAVAVWVTYKAGGFAYLPERLSKSIGLLFHLTHLLVYLRGFGARQIAQKEVKAFVKMIKAQEQDVLDEVERMEAPAASNLSLLVESVIPTYRPWNIEEIRDVTYATPEEVQEAGADSLPFLQLDILRKKSGYKNRPLLIYIHGGAWHFGDKNKPPMGRTMPLCYHFSANENWVVLNVNYRLTPKYKLKDSIIDLKRVIRWARTHTHVHGGDPNYIAVSGGSAGGHLCTLLALTPNWVEFQPGFEDVDTKVQACLAIYPANHPMHTEAVGNWFKRHVVRMTDEESQQEVGGRKVGEWADPLYVLRGLKGAEARKEIPPFFVIQGTHDTLVSTESVRTFVNELKIGGHVPSGYLELPDTHHGFDGITSPRTIYACWAAGQVMEACYEVHQRRKGKSKL